jgi:hypothetical protein
MVWEARRGNEPNPFNCSFFERFVLVVTPTNKAQASNQRDMKKSIKGTRNNSVNYLVNTQKQSCKFDVLAAT